MLDILTEIARVSAWTGLSAGALVVLGVAAWYLPGVRTTAIAAAFAVAAGYVGLMHGHATGRAEVQKAWKAADDRAEAAAKARDEDAATLAADDEKRQAEVLARARAKDQETINALRKADAKCHPVTRYQLR